ncbi:FAD-binding oxidoreductase [Hydrogenophaga sp. PAMC20947]|uniref:FAD-binding oxidoreductase n=1 Tax=Hydrogenophaga sp. PAMC20947 TaxID=2565558 RepID=UPI00109DD610|nr:FAD-binding oxidoreductase [Hydrogenophaga sp. PAMC20947]QCB44591.1 FAD-binding oxidoreductase [Hydrogenophaga sp. PAMC20947]
MRHATPAESPSGALARSLAAFKSRLSGELLTPLDAAYNDARFVWNGMIDRHPLAISRCKSIADVVASVRFAGESGWPVSIRAGGHNVAGHAVCDKGLMIDLSQMRGVKVNPVEKSASVEGGALWADVDTATQAHGLATPGGLISDTGVAGLTLSGGVGWLRSAHGLCIDNLLAVEVVTADGALIRASLSENADLFWAMRGGGRNFGVVVSFEFKLHPVGPTVMFAAPIYPLSSGAGPIRFWRDFLADKSDVIGSICEFSTVAASSDYPEKFWGTRCYTLAAVYAGDASDGERVLQPLRQLGPMVADFSGQMPYSEVQKLFDALFPAGEFRCYWKSHLLSKLTDQAIEEAIENAAASPSDQSISSFWNFGGATAAVPADATAFGDRSFGWMYSLDSVWRDPKDDEKVIGWTRSAWSRARKHAHHGRLYLNFAGQDADSDELTRDAFGQNYVRLAHIKNRYDPGNMFRFNQNIKPV